MNQLKEHFNEAANNFDKQINSTIPYYEDMLKALVNSIPNTKENPKILDLGCGTGNITQKVKKRFPNAEITCLDLSDKMIEIAKDKLQNYNNIEYIIGDFTKYKFQDKYDAIISSLALHHIRTDNDKEIMYKDIYNALKTNGTFYNADVTKPNSKYNKELSIILAEEYMMKHAITEKEIKDHEQKQEDNDSPITLIKHLKMLEKVGFKEIDVLWKYYSNTVYGGTKK